MAAKGQSPYSIGILSTNINQDLDTVEQMAKYKQDEMDAKAPHTLPHELKELPQYFGNIVENGIQAAKILETVLKSENFKNRKKLQKLNNNLNKIIFYLLKNVDSTLAMSTIGAKEEDFDIDKDKN